MIDVEIEADAWTAAAPEAQEWALRAAMAALQFSPRGTGGGDHAQRGEGGETGEGGADDPAPSTVLRAAPLPRFAGEEQALTILLTDDATVHDLNARFRGTDRPTNVLSFPSAGGDPAYLGDVALAYQTCAREADEQGKPLAHHLAHLVAHGTLHLLGFDHESDAEAEAMESKERALLRELGVPDPYGDDHG